MVYGPIIFSLCTSPYHVVKSVAVMCPLLDDRHPYDTSQTVFLQNSDAIMSRRAFLCKATMRWEAGERLLDSLLFCVPLRCL